MKPKLLLLTLVIAFLFASVSWAATTGKITGVITDAGTGDPLAGVSISIVDTKLGGYSDAEGNYTILNVSVGTYVLRISSVGYATVEVANVQVSADMASYQNQALSSKATDIGTTIKVIAEQPLVTPDKTASINIIKQDQILALPTRGFEQIVGIQNSVVRVRSNVVTRQRGGRETNQQGELNLRGGRTSEVAYYVDGFSQQDPLSGISSSNISNNAIQEVSIIAGGFPVEYGNVSSGIVNTTTRSGSAKYVGTAEIVTDNIGPQQSFDQNWYSANLSGPIPGLEGSNFFGSIERRYFGDRNPSAIASDVLPGNPDLLPNNSLDGWSWQGKLNFQISPNLKLVLSNNGSRDKWREYLHTYLFNQEHLPYYDDQNNGFHGKLTHTLNANTYYNLSASYFVTERFRGDGVFKEDLAAYGQASGNARFNQRALFWNGATDSTEGHVWDDYLRRKSSYIGFKGDINTQVNSYHTLKFGFDYERHTLRFYDALFPALTTVDTLTGKRVQVYADIDRYGYDSVGNEIESDNNLGFAANAVKHPINLAFFTQDRMEWRGLIITAGVRFDYFDYKADRIRDAARPLDPDISKPETQKFEKNDLEASEKFTRVSPRLGLAFPVSDKTQMRLNYGKFFQRPDLRRLYVGDSYFEQKVKQGGYYYAFGNPNLEPEKTTQYEVGMQIQLGDNTVVDAAFFYKDVLDLVQVIAQPAQPRQYSTFSNLDYGTIKGLEASLTMRRTEHVSFNVKYTLSWANGTGSNANTQRNVAWQNADPPKQPSALDFDQRHSLIGDVDWRAGKGEGPQLGNVYPLENVGINILVTAASGLPYSPSAVWNEVTLGAGAPSADAPRNSAYGPWTFNIDMKIEKTFKYGSFSVVPFLWIKNLLDRDNVAQVFESTGRANSTNWLSTEQGLAFINSTPQLDGEKGLTAEEEYNIKQNDPSNYLNPRQIYAGLRLTF